MTEYSSTIPAYEPPAWFEEFSSAQHYAAHLVLSGNLRDVFPVSQSDKIAFLGLLDTLAMLVEKRGIDAMLVYDPVAGLSLRGKGTPALAKVLHAVGSPLEKGPLSLGELARVQSSVMQNSELAIAFVVDHASHLCDSMAAEREAFFVQMDSQCRATRAGHGQGTPRNPTVWLVDKPTDLPHWFVVGNELLREIQVDIPNLEDRFLFAEELSREFGLLPEVSGEDPDKLLQEFALECDGETLAAMNSITRVATAEGISVARISDAIRVYRTGISRNPWSSKVLANRLRQGKALLQRRIKGQDQAIEKTVDILARSVVGLSGSQSGARHLRPRGVLFLAGPTGVGKTELAKAVTELLFGDDTACHRFDMSEFMEEDSVSRLIGAPPGQPGHERGGELVNAAHRRPFSVFLFDEVEKAHPRILDVFLQILDEGRLTDSRGATAHFSEALIVFTSNIGMTSRSRAQNLGMNVLPSDDHEKLEEKIGELIEDHFRVVLQRPELHNRIGQNIIVFDFLSSEAAAQIFDAVVVRVLEAVRFERRIKVEISELAYNKLKQMCVSDFFQGGRGIGNRIEGHLINPLAREIFDQDINQDMTVVDADVDEDGRTRLKLNPSAN